MPLIIIALVLLFLVFTFVFHTRENSKRAMNYDLLRAFENFKKKEISASEYLELLIWVRRHKIGYGGNVTDAPNYDIPNDETGNEFLNWLKQNNLEYDWKLGT